MAADIRMTAILGRLTMLYCSLEVSTMSEPEPPHGHSLLVRDGQPLIGIIVRENGQEVTRYFADEAAADATTSKDDIKVALAAIGAFSDLDFDEMMADLDRIRHESKPTPPIDLDL
jgi:hypothetical protein